MCLMVNVIRFELTKGSLALHVVCCRYNHPEKTSQQVSARWPSNWLTNTMAITMDDTKRNRRHILRPEIRAKKVNEFNFIKQRNWPSSSSRYYSMSGPCDLIILTVTCSLGSNLLVWSVRWPTCLPAGPCKVTMPTN